MKDWKKRKKQEQEEVKPQMQAEVPANDSHKPTWSTKRKSQVPNTGRSRKERKG